MNSKKQVHNNSIAANEKEIERPISKAYKMIDNDLARDNLENNMPAAELEDL